MIPLKHSFSLLSRKDVKKIRLNFKLSKKSKRITKQNNEISIPETNMEIDKKRAFLRFASLAGLGVIASIFIPKKAQALSFGGGAPVASKVKLKNSSNTQIDSATNATLTTTKTNFDSLHTKDADIIANTAGIIANTAKIPTLTHYGSMASSTPIAIADGQSTVQARGIGKFTTANLSATDDDSLWYLRIINRQLQSLNTVDSKGRQRKAVDAANDMQFTATGAVTTGGAGFGLKSYQDMAKDISRNEFANGIRKKLVFY